MKDLLATYPEAECWHNMPVPFGFGRPVLDFIVCFRGWFMAIETKRPKDGTLTTRQILTMQAIDRANGIVVYVADEGDLAGLKSVLDRLPTLHRPTRSVAVLGLQPKNVVTTRDDPVPAHGILRMNPTQDNDRAKSDLNQNPSTGGNTTEERAAYAVNPGLPGSVDEGPKTHAQEVFGNTAVSEKSVDPDRPLYGEEPGEGGMGRAVSPMQGQEYYNQDEKGPGEARNYPGGPADVVPEGETQPENQPEE